VRSWIDAARSSSFRACQLNPVGGAGILNASHAPDQVKGIAVDTAVSQMSIIDVNCNDIANHQAAARWGFKEINNLVQSAFEADGGLGDSRSTHNLRRLWSHLR